MLKEDEIKVTIRLQILKRFTGYPFVLPLTCAIAVSFWLDRNQSIIENIYSAVTDGCFLVVLYADPPIDN
jgi:hypothetical protein